MLLNEDSLRNLWDNMKCANIHITKVPEEERKGQKNLYEEVMAENSPNLGKETHKIQKIQSIK